MLPEEDRRALKKNGYQISAKGVISPIANPLQTYNRKSSSSEIQLYRQGERNPSNNHRPIQPKATTTTSNNQRYGSANAAEHRSAALSPKPKPTPNLRGMSPDAAERWSAGSNPQPKPKPFSYNRREWENAPPQPKLKPPSSNKATQLQRQELIRENQNLINHSSPETPPKPKPTPTALNTRRYGSADAAERWTSGSTPQAKPKPTPTVSNNRRYGSADAASRWNGGTSPQPQLTTAPWGNQYFNNRPLTSPPASEPPKPEPKKSWWDKAGDFVKEKTSDAWDKTKSAGTFVKDHASEIGHGALDVAGFVPVIGAAADGINGVWYAAQGDRTNAALSFAAAIPIVGDAAAAAKGVGKVANAVKDAKATKTYLTYTLKDSDEVVRYVGRASGKGTPQEVLAGRISKGHHVLQSNANLKPHLEAVQGNRAANRGAEDVLYSRYQVPNPNQINGKTLAPGANKGGQQLLNETNPLSNISWKAKTIGRRKIEAYANDLNQP